MLVCTVLGALIWAAGWGWDAPFTYMGDIGMFGGPYGNAKVVGCVIAIPAVGMAAGSMGLPWAGAAGVTVGFGVLWSADALITYSNAFWVLGVAPMWALVALGAFVGAWVGVRLAQRGRAGGTP